MRPLQITLTASVIALAAASYSPVFANAAPGNSAVPQCCTDNALRVDGLESKVDRLERLALQTNYAEIRIAGLINRMVQWQDNGFRSHLSHVDNNNLSSNIAVQGKAKFTPDLTFNANVTLSVSGNTVTGATGSSSFYDVGRTQKISDSEKNILISRSEVEVDSFKYGKLSLGRGPMASTGAMFFQDLSFTYSFLHPFTTMGGINFRYRDTFTAAGPLAAAGTVLNHTRGNPFGGSGQKTGVQIFNPGDGTNVKSSGERIKYTTPTVVNLDHWLHGFSAEIAHAYMWKGNVYDAAIKYTDLLRIPYSQTKTIVSAVISWQRNQSKDYTQGLLFADNSVEFGRAALGFVPNTDTFVGRKHDTFAGSVGILFPFSMSGKYGTGINVMFAGAHRKWKITGHEKGRVLHGKLGYTDNFIKLGSTHLVGSYGQWKAMDVDFMYNALAPNLTFTPHLVGTNWGVGVQQDVDGANAQVYLRYDNMRLQRRNTFIAQVATTIPNTFKPVHIVYSGVMVRL